MKRQVRIKIDFVVEIDDDGVGLPVLPIGDTGRALGQIAQIVAPGAAALVPGGRISAGLTRESSIEIRRMRRATLRSRGAAP